MKGPKSHFSLGVSHTQALYKCPGTLNGLEESALDPEGFSFNHWPVHFLECEIPRGPREATGSPLYSPPLVCGWGQACLLLPGFLWYMKGGWG